MNELQLPFRPDWFLSVNLRAQGFNVALAVTRTDGAELSELDQRTVRAAVVALAEADRQAYAAFKAANAAAAKARRAAPAKASAKPSRAAAKATPSTTPRKATGAPARAPKAAKRTTGAKPSTAAPKAPKRAAAKRPAK